MAERLYKIMEQNSTGWHLHDTAAQNLTKQQCNEWLNRLVNDGANPSDLKAIFQEDTRYDDRLPLT
tara:strand:+ start:233 stop:430 length:198 start_codon:yes stop_codon:yes gene_type:complete